MYFVYLLESSRDSGWYIGYSEDVYRRLERHNSGENPSTKDRRPFRLIYFEAYISKCDALGRERYLKSGAGHRFLRKQLGHFLQNKG